jgi:uncharacterized protein
MPEPIVRQSRRARAIQVGPLREWSEFEIDFPIVDLSPEFDGFRILHLSDTHFGPTWYDAYDRLLARVQSLSVDLVAFTGDWVEDKFDFRLGVDCARRFAGGLRAKFGVYSVLGNHDGDLLAGPLVDAGITLLVGQSQRIVGADGAIEIIGMPSVTRDDTSSLLIESFATPSPGVVRLVLTHYPDDVKRLHPLKPTLLLAGHTHGGQICLPGGRSLLTHDSLPRPHAGGMTHVHGTWLHVSRGIGCSKWPIRTWCPPEISIIRLCRDVS